jgi:predicted N-formylglutamate amidohydrolase
MGLLGSGDSQPVIAERAGSGAAFLFVCDHAGRQTPAKLADLGLPTATFDLHVAWDIGAAAVTRRLAASLDAPAIYQRYSRLVIDCNRDPDSPDAVPPVSDGIAIPGNVGLSSDERQDRIAEIHAPYHAAIAAELDARVARGLPTTLVFMHSFTPRMGGFQRPWHFGVIREPNSRFSKAALEQLRSLDGVVTGDNQPYAMDGIDYSCPIHALARGLDYLELEIRQDLIADEAGQARVAELLLGVLTKASAAAHAG